MTQSNALSAAAEAELQDILRRYPNKMAAIVPVLHLCQRERATDGWFVTPELEAFVADRLDMPLAKVREVISFYTMFNKRPVGRYHLQLCSTLSCALAGSDRIYEHLCARLGIAKGETTPTACSPSRASSASVAAAPHPAFRSTTKNLKKTSTKIAPRRFSNVCANGVEPPTQPTSRRIRRVHRQGQRQSS